MKKIKLFLIAFISLLLPSCSNAPSPSLKEKNIISNESERLNNMITIPPYETNIASSRNDTKLPISGKEPSGENIQGVRENSKSNGNFRFKF